METKIGTDISLAASLLMQGELVAIPTETVYGLAGNALDESVVLNIFKTKERPTFDPLIVHVGNISDVENYAQNIPASAYKIMQELWPGPVTLLLQKKNIIPDLVTSGLDTVAIRMPNHPMTMELLRSIKFPLAAPSANPFGYVSPTSAQHVADQLGGKISYILDGGLCEVGIESTIIGFEDDRCIIYRLGGMDLEKIEQLVGSVEVMKNISTDPKAPGMLKSHYAPGKPVYFGELSELLKTYGQKNGAVLCFTSAGFKFHHDTIVYELSVEENLEQAAHFLFAALRKFDQSDAKFLLAEKFPDKGLGKAINDRLIRAAFRE